MSTAAVRFNKTTGRFEVVAPSDLGVSISDIGGLAAALSARVQTINGVGPDGSGNVETAAVEATQFWFYG